MELSEENEINVKSRTAFNLERMERVAMMYTPSAKLRQKHEATRAAQKFCKVCYYIREARLAMQAFTKYVCRNCESEQTHHNSNTPAYCPTCTEANHLCTSCGALRDP